MSAPLTYGIAAKAKNADCAAFFLNWVATNEKARQIDVAIGGSNPGGPTGLPIPPAPAARSPTRRWLPAPSSAKTGAMDFIANATSSIFAQGWTPELQKMVGGKQDAAGLLKAVQAEYAKGALPLSYGADEAGLAASPITSRQMLVGGSHGGSPGSGVPPANHPWLAVRGASAGHVRRVRAPAARLEDSVLALPLGRCRPATWVGLSNYADRPQRADARRDTLQRVPAHPLL